MPEEETQEDPPEVEEEGEEEIEQESETEDNIEEEPEIYEFTENSGYTGGELVSVYDEISEEDYLLDEDSEKILIGKSSWNEIEGLLSEGESPSSWTDRIKSHLFEHDKSYGIGGATGIGSGLLAGGLGYTTAAGLLLTGGAASLGIGLGSYLMKKGGYLDLGSEDIEEEDSDHELADYSEWNVEILDQEGYEQAIQEYAESQE